MCQGKSRASQWLDVTTSGDLGVLRGSTNSISRLHLPPYPRGSL